MRTRKNRYNKRGGLNLNPITIMENITSPNFIKQEISDKLHARFFSMMPDGLTPDQKDAESAELTEEILRKPAVKNFIEKIQNKTTNLKNLLENNARHEIIGAIPLEIGEAINMALDTFLTGDKSLKLLEKTNKLKNKVSSLINLSKTAVPAVPAVPTVPVKAPIKAPIKTPKKAH